MGGLLAAIDPAKADTWVLALTETLGILPSILSASPDAQMGALSDRRAVALLQSVRAIMLETHVEEALSGPIIASAKSLLDYLHVSLAHAPAEEVRALYLDGRKRLIREAVVALGTLDEAPIYPREVLRRALEARASGLILVHNHPSGDATPSAGDKAATARLAEAAHLLGIRLYDHLIIAKSGCSSFRALGLL